MELRSVRKNVWWLWHKTIMGLEGDITRRRMEVKL